MVEASDLKKKTVKPTTGQLKWLTQGLTQPGGKLPLFDENGQRVSKRTVESCLEKGLTQPGRDILKEKS